MKPLCAQLFGRSVSQVRLYLYFNRRTVHGELCCGKQAPIRRELQEPTLAIKGTPKLHVAGVAVRTGESVLQEATTDLCMLVRWLSLSLEA